MVLRTTVSATRFLRPLHSLREVSPEHVIPVLIAKQAPKEEGERVFDAMTVCRAVRVASVSAVSAISRVRTVVPPGL